MNFIDVRVGSQSAEQSQWSCLFPPSILVLMHSTDPRGNADTTRVCFNKCVRWKQARVLLIG